MDCKFCGSTQVVRYGKRSGIQYYVCRSCRRTFAGTDAPEGMRTPLQEISTALKLYYYGLSLSVIQRHLNHIYMKPVETSTIYRWVLKYAQKASMVMENYRVKTCNTWLIDETVIQLDGTNVWFWDVIDENTRFILASHISRTRTMDDAEIILNNATENTTEKPNFIVSDGMLFYPDGIEKVFGSDGKYIKMIDTSGEINKMLFEEFHDSLKQRTKIIRGLKSINSARLLLGGFLVHYNYFKPRISLEDKTPAQVAEIQIPFQNWEDLIKYQY